jgi:hypothetical protein
MQFQSSLKCLEFKGRALVMLTNGIALSNRDFNEFGINLTTNACLCKMQGYLYTFWIQCLYEPPYLQVFLLPTSAHQ